MSRFRVEINTDSAAFSANPSELDKILRNLLKRAGGLNETEGVLQDSNGDAVGRFWVE